MTNLPLRPPLYRFHCWSDSDFAFKWILPPILSYREANLLQPIRSTTQIWAVTRHQYGISASVLQTSIWRGNRWWRREMSAVFSFSIIHYYQWWIQGRGPEGPAPHLIFDQNEAERAEKNFFGDRLPPPPHWPLIIVFIFSVNPCRKQSWTSPKSLKLPLQFVAHSFHQV